MDNGKKSVSSLKEFRQSLKLDYIMSDMENLIQESMNGADRVKCSDSTTFAGSRER